MTNDDTMAMEVHLALRLLDKAAGRAYCHHYPGVNRPGNCGICRPGHVSTNNPPAPPPLPHPTHQ